MKVTKIDAWKTSDGTIFTEEFSANEYEQKQTMIGKLKKLIVDEYGSSNMSISQMAEFVYDNRTPIMDIIDDPKPQH